MGPYFIRSYPYSNLHDLNLDWLINELMQIKGYISIDSPVGYIERDILDGNGNLVYRFRVDSQGIKMIDPISGVSNPYIKWDGKNIELTQVTAKNLLYSNGDTYVNSRINIDDGSATNHATKGVIEVKEDRHLQFWTKKEGGQPEHYSLPVPTADTPQYYNILTTKDDDVISQNIPITHATATGWITVTKYRHVVSVTFSIIHDDSYVAYEELATMPEQFRPITGMQILAPVIANVGGAYGIIRIQDSGAVTFYLGDTTHFFSGTTSYLV